MAGLNDLKEFDIQDASVALWVVKGPRSLAGSPPTYTGRWVSVDDDLQSALRSTVAEQRDGIGDVEPYGLLANPLDGGALAIEADETHAPILTSELVEQSDARRVRTVKHLHNSAFYVVKLVDGDRILHAVRQTTPAWRTKNSKTYRSVIFKENELTLDEKPRFEIAKTIDFFIYDGTVFVRRKAGFETILIYKEAHQEDFRHLQAEPAFQGVFVDLAPLVAHVGVNKLLLRRVSAIKQKAHYRDADFMRRLHQHAGALGFSIRFNNQGKIIATPETCAEIMTALLDHRLTSIVSNGIFDVPSSTPVAPRN
ncbi:Kiwa anti-phage protein KwaB-like domain-containing protein [Fulvimarina sp. MAC8]|uniref:Kiwa anti-phage protein KwaB-like domain-containing protein n=1 Tax=Fulvimarina sp. MAC8 TaxID=3162874 RepID=UPI0032EF11E3